MTNTYAHLTPAFRFTPDKLIEMVPNVGSIIDLTATDKYYNPALFTTRGIRHTKIGCGGRGTIPFEAIVHRFFDVVDAFLLSAHSRGKVLMVHCTHGLNRTGYLVSRYLVERRAFNQARGHNIERHNYLAALRQKSDSVCRNPVPLFQKSGPRPGHQEPTTASHDRPTSSNSHHLAQGGRSGTHDHSPPFSDYHQPPTVAQSQTDVQPQSASRSQNSVDSPVDAGRRKQKSNRSNPPPASSSEQRRENRHLRFYDQSVGERLTSPIGISHNCNRVDPAGQHDGRRRDLKVHSYSSRSSH
ncbi:hypothetical protein DAPPUDRAFT_118640 [Daphnia pulex]|uniref:Tyrosine specific protein phosphatases domain-containing protein n=1 Tax=Daphnia pulex TaxID=6669 RepID=E9HW91_DAPPU|nr:hypothetical protein DAPPUDRAFT_118640 [Daphnia pulex]|eukprot:EFX63987.1 hypothetical protein DAPPUDRAFT_118640 [Daphnia pulex]